MVKTIFPFSLRAETLHSVDHDIAGRYLRRAFRALPMLVEVPHPGAI